MKQQTKRVIEKLLLSYPKLEKCREDLGGAFDLLSECYKLKGKVLVCGNGGSASDSEHIVGELMKGFLLKRELNPLDMDKIEQAFPEEGEYLSRNLQGCLPAISLVSHPALCHAFINDVAPDMVFAQQVFGYAKTEDVLMGLSTSGNSKNVIHAIQIAKVLGAKTIGLTGENGGRMDSLCDIAIKVPAVETYKIQELHLPVYHALCAMLETEFFG